MVKLDKSLLDFHIDDLDQKISKQLDAVMHHPEFQKVESLWRGTWFVVQRTDFRKNVRIELLDISKEHLRQDFDDSRKSFRVVYIVIHTFRNTIRRVANL